MKKLLLTYICLFTGAFLQGMSMSLFLFPHSIPSGGAAGIALLINHWFDLSLGFSLWLANAVFLLFALNFFGYTWTFRTVLSVATTSATISFFTMQVPVQPGFLLLDMAAGSLFFGLGVGLLIRAGASSGGMVIPALMIAFHKNWSPGKVMMGINLFIFLLTSLVIDYKIVIFAIVCQFMSTNVIDFIYHLKIHKITSMTVSWRRR
ncbi:YitT family protein [Siminovitchia fortis]|uniref:YitT family protein n=1 Tax=Siminovitchia fortis TaxID=254758 RepID=A0A443IPE2_9BACI|nr:YitT family protein [Siminovitchia fortis]RWR08428.1 YitT family protein [Siminovitchia fortis]WHY83097.1 YitT family protein [Siminovitchia fortis]